MNRKTTVSVVLTLGVVGMVGAWEIGRRTGLTGPTGQATGSAPPPNVLIIVADDLGVDKVGAYLVDVDPGYGERARAMPATPVLDSLAASGVRFTDAWANPACSPTRGTLLTGTFPFRHGVGSPIGKDGAAELGTDETTFAHLAADAGYSSGLFGKWHLGEGEVPDTWTDDDTWEDHLGELVPVDVPAIQLGFNAFRGTRADLQVGDFTGYYDWLRLTAVTKVGSYTVPTGETEYATIATTDAALEWINTQTTPWVASVNYHAPHTPFSLPPEDCGYSVQSELRENLVYRSMVECLDQQIGELLDGIGTLSNTVVIFLGDNGTEAAVAEDLFDDGRGKGTLYESGVRVPFIVADGIDYQAETGQIAPAVARRGLGVVESPGREVADPVHAADVFATIADLLKQSPRAGADSVSMMPLLQDTDGEVREFAYSELFTDTSGTAAFRRGNAKLIVSARAKGGAMCRSRSELYDVLVDRFEVTDLAETEPELLAELQSQLDALIAEVPGHWLDVPEC